MMKKRTLYLTSLLLVTSLSVLAAGGCGRKNTSQTESESSSETEAKTESETESESESESQTDSENLSESAVSSQSQVQGFASAPKTAPSQKSSAAVQVTPSSKTVYASKGINIRSGAGTEYSILDGAFAGDALEQTGICDNGWIEISWNGVKAYVDGEYVADTPPAAETAASGSSQETSASSGTEGAAAAPSPWAGSSDSGVQAAVQVYAGNYRDSAIFSGENAPAEYSMISVSNVTDRSFDFIVYKADLATGEILETLYPASRAVFDGNGTTASCTGADGASISFSFPDYHGAAPAATDMVVSGIPALEGKTMSNNGIPGHEFS